MSPVVRLTTAAHPPSNEPRGVLSPPPASAAGPRAAGEAEDRALCYHVLGKVHGCWTPLPRTLKDYISSPKPNGYRSLHTTVLVGTQPLEYALARALQPGTSAVP